MVPRPLDVRLLHPAVLATRLTYHPPPTPLLPSVDDMPAGLVERILARLREWEAENDEDPPPP